MIMAGGLQCISESATTQAVLELNASFIYGRTGCMRWELEFIASR
jgi:hypothetical protein